MQFWFVRIKMITGKEWTKLVSKPAQTTTTRVVIITNKATKLKPISKTEITTDDKYYDMKFQLQINQQILKKKPFHQLWKRVRPRFLF